MGGNERHQHKLFSLTEGFDEGLSQTSEVFIYMHGTRPQNSSLLVHVLVPFPFAILGSSSSQSTCIAYMYILQERPTLLNNL